MTSSEHEETSRGPGMIGYQFGTRIEVRVVDATDADATIAVVGMFSHEPPATPLSGGLLRLDQAMGGALLRMRADGIFAGAVGETMMFSTPAPPVRAGSILVVGLGDPLEWTVEVMRRAVAAAACTVIQIGADDVAFAPSVLDGGLRPEQVAGIENAMLGGLWEVLSASTGRTPERWTFCVGDARFQMAKEEFTLALDALAAAWTKP